MSDPQEIQAAIDKIQKLLRRTEANGAAENEVDSAAKQIGRLVMKFPQLLDLDFINRDVMPFRTARSQSDNSTSVTLNHRGVVQESMTAVLVAFGHRELWVRKRQIYSISETDIRISRTAATELGLI